MATARLLAGRTHEVGLLQRFLDDLPLGPRLLVLDGEVGIGKTTLLDRVVASARGRGWRVLTASPVESELPWEFAALVDLFGGLPPDLVRRLPPPQRRALGVVVFRDEVPQDSVDPLTLATAVRSILGVLAEESPVVLAIDDLPWLDAPSSRILEFVFRRVGEVPIGLVGTVRTTWEPRPAPLFTDDMEPGAGRSADRRAVWGRGDRPSSWPIAIPPSCRRPRGCARSAVGRTATRWSPCNFSVSPPRSSARSRCPRSGSRCALRRLIGGRLHSLRPETRDVLLVAAISNSATVVRTMAAARDPATARGALHDAVEAGIVSVHGDVLTFAHPMIRAVVIDEAAPVERRQAHRRSAERCSSPEERARHLALGSEGPDEAVASEIEQAAELAAGRGAPETAADLAALSVELTPADHGPHAGADPAGRPTGGS